MSAQTTGQSRGFHVAHQKAHVSIDFARRALDGWTEITIIPSTPELRTVVLDAREMRILRVFVNQQEAEFEHRDLQRNPPECPSSWTVEQHHFLREKYETLFTGAISGELEVFIPRDVDIVENDGSTFLVSLSNQDKSYQPITIRIEYELTDPRSGVTFVGGENSSIPKLQWHAYTTHSPLGKATSCWLPCVDGYWEFCTWELTFSVPKTVREMIWRRDTDADMEICDEEKEADDDDELRIEIAVVSNNSATDQIVNPSDPAKKDILFEIFTPISAQHIGFVAGPLVQVQLSSNEDENDDINGSNSVPLIAYALGHKAQLISHCCSIFTTAMECFTRDFGSYPFSSYSLCFVGDSAYDAVDAAGLSIVSENLLFPQSVIEPLFKHTERFIRCLAAQWCGVNIVPKTWDDIWVTEGIAMYMTHCFVRKLMGNNEYRFRMRKYNDEITRQDINRNPIGKPEFRFPINVDDLRFFRLKAPMVLYILDRRMKKTDRSLGLSRVIPKLFLQSMSGDLHSMLGTSHFIKVCERVTHHHLDQFFNAWVFSSGYPIFRVTQRFNKKRMFIEMGIGQVQSRELPSEVLTNDDFLDQAVADIIRERNNQQVNVPAVFTGPMTIRIHEADGTPYEHVVDLKEFFTKLDIQYNTKYKRLKRNQRYKSAATETDHVEEQESELIHCLGDVLMRDRDIEAWKLSDWGQDDEEYMFNEAFEWIRVDSDFEWLGKMFVGQPDYMYASQLQQDRDVIAQYDAVNYFSTQPPNAIYSSILTRTLMDRRYFYGVRVHAAFGLSAFAVESLNYLGKFHLTKCFQEMFCFPGSLIPKANDFCDFANYFVQKAIPLAMSMIRDSAGQCPKDVRNFLLDLVRYNENSGNPYSDCYYLSALITAVVNTVQPMPNVENAVDLHDSELREFVEKTAQEVDKCQRLDRWIPSYNNVVTVTAIAQDELIVRAGFGVPRMGTLLQFTEPNNPVSVRLVAFQVAIDLGAYHSPEFLDYLFFGLLYDPSQQMRVGLVKVLKKWLGVIASQGEFVPPDVPSPRMTDPIKARQDGIARQAVRTAIPLLRNTLADNKRLRQLLWETLLSSRLDCAAKRVLFDICVVLVPPKNSFIVSLPTPKLYHVVAKRRSTNYHIVIKYRSVLQKAKVEPVEQAHDDDGDGDVDGDASSPAPPPSIKLKLGLGLR